MTGEASGQELPVVSHLYLADIGMPWGERLSGKGWWVSSPSGIFAKTIIKISEGNLSGAGLLGSLGQMAQRRRTGVRTRCCVSWK